MKTTLMRNLGALALTCLFFLIPAGAHADVVTVGDYVKLTDRPGSPGGEFGLTVYDTPGGGAIDKFITFCVQMNEYIDFSSTFVVKGVSDHSDGPTPRALDQRTAYLYTQFRSGGLAGYNYGPNGAGNAASADQLQKAIWYFQGQISNPGSNQFITAANQAVSQGLWSGLGNVRVLNLFYQNGTRAQDQLTLVPEPTTLVLLTSGLVALGIRRRKVAC